MDIERLLSVHESQGAPPAVVAEVRSVLAFDREVDAERYVPERVAELKRERRQRAAEAIAGHLSALEGDAAKAAAVEQELHARREHERVTSANGHGVDPRSIDAAASPAELDVLLRDAEAADAGTLRKAWTSVEPRLKAMALDDQRRHRLPHAASALHVLTTWQARARDVTRRAPTASDLREAAQRARREVRDKVLAVADAVGLRAAVERAAKEAAVAGVRPAAGMVFGPYWQANRPQSRR